MNKPSNNQAGFTLIELTIASVILSLMLVILTQLFINLVHQDRAAVSVQDSTQNVRYALDDISAQARLANSVTVLPANTPAGFDQVCLYEDSSMVQYFSIAPVVSGGQQLLYKRVNQGTGTNCGILTTVNPGDVALISGNAGIGVTDFQAKVAPINSLTHLVPGGTVPTLTVRVGVTTQQASDATAKQCTGGTEEYCSITSIETTVSLRGTASNGTLTRQSSGPGN